MAYNIVDINENIITENISEQEAIEIAEANSKDTEFTYFFYPLDANVLADLKAQHEGTDVLRFFKRVIEE